jgi:lysozyme
MIDFIYQIAQDLIRDEGLELKPYMCPAGKLTIGIGRNIEDVGISEQEALYLLQNDIECCINDLHKMGIQSIDITPNRWCALVNMRFNLGPSRFRQFKKMLAAIHQREFGKAADEMMDSKWAKQVEGRAERLEKMIREG